MSKRGQFSDGMRRSNDQGKVVALAARQHLVVALDQLVALGISARAVQRGASAGRLHRIYPGVYSLVPPRALTRQGRWMAAVLACGQGAVVSHRTAAKLHGLLNYQGTKLDVTVPRRRVRKPEPRVVVHRSRTLTARDVTVVENIPCTTVARTLLDLAEVVDRRRHERAFDQAEIEQVLDMAAIDDQLRGNATRTAARRTRALLAEHYPGSTPTESRLEEAFLALCRRAGLPQPELQQTIHLPDGGEPIRADFLWRRERVIVETDGERVHNTHQRRRSDRRKDQRLTVYGFRPLRTDAQQVFGRPAELEARLKALVGGT